MDVEYKGQHSIIFYKDVGTGYKKRHSWMDFHMIPASRPYVALGEPNISQVSIPGTSKRVDLTDYTPGGLTFGGRNGTWEFYIDHTRWPSWSNSKSAIQEYIHGNTFLINLTDDPYTLYQGILTISGYVAGQNYSKITIQYDLMNDVITLDEPIDLGEFGRFYLPDPKWIDEDGDGEADGLDVTGDGKIDFYIVTIIGYDVDGDGDIDVEVDPDEPLPDPEIIDSDDDGKPEGLDINGDGVIDIPIVDDDEGNPGFDLDGDGKPDVTYDPANPPKLVDDNGDGIPDGIDLDGDDKPDIQIKEETGVDIDGDGKPDVHVDPDDLPDPKWIDADGDGIPDGIDIDGDGSIDKPVDQIDEDGDGIPDGVDIDGDGIIDIRYPDEDSPAEDPVDVIGAYYPLQFVYPNGDTSSQYGMKTVNKSGKTFGVYDLYTIYESDRVTGGSQVSGDNDGIAINYYEPVESIDIIFTE